MSKVLFNISYTSKRPPAKLKGAARADYLASRKFYDLTAEYNALSYMLDGKKVEKNKDALDYFTRGGENEGLFNLDGVLSKADIESLKDRLAKTDSIIWHGFLSFDEETTKGFQTQEQAIQFMKQSFSAFLERTHLKPENVELFAALHTDRPTHHHIHFSFFEKEPKHRDKNGKLSYTAKGTIHPGAIENYLISANMHLSEHPEDYYTARDRAMEKLNAIRAPKVIAYGEADLVRRLNALARKLPATGRLQYNAAGIAPFRAEIDELAAVLIRTNPEANRQHQEMQRIFAQKEQEVRKIARDNNLGYINGRRLSKAEIKEILDKGKTKFLEEKHIDFSHIDYIEKLRSDYKARLGNRVLGLVKGMKKEYAQERRAAVNDKSLKIKGPSA